MPTIYVLRVKEIRYSTIMIILRGRSTWKRVMMLIAPRPLKLCLLCSESSKSYLHHTHQQRVILLMNIIMFFTSRTKRVPTTTMASRRENEWEIVLSTRGSNVLINGFNRDFSLISRECCIERGAASEVGDRSPCSRHRALLQWISNISDNYSQQKRKQLQEISNISDN